MKKRILIPAILILLISLIISGIKIYSSVRFGKNSAWDSLDANEISMLNPGDIILRKGKSFASEIISNFLKSPLNVSHCGLIVEYNDELSVIHSVSRSLSGFDGIQIEALSDFLLNSQPQSNIVVRYNGGRTQIDSFIEEAFSLLALKLPFDNSFELDNGANLYCTELFWEILPDNFRTDAASFKLNKIIAFESFLHPDIFSVIIDHREL